MSDQERPRYWTMETVFETYVQTVVGEDLCVSVEPEVPFDEQDRRLTRHGNRYWPTFVEVEGGSDKFWLEPSAARDFAKALMQAAEAAEAIDKPDVDRCGHWAPCDHCKAQEEHNDGC